MDSPTATPTPEPKAEPQPLDLQSIRGKHAALRHTLQNDETASFRQQLMDRVNSDERAKHYSLYHNFDTSML